MGLFPPADMEENVHLLRGRIRNALCRDSRPVVTILLHELPNVLERALQLLLRIKVHPLLLRRVDDLVRSGMRWSPLHLYLAHKKINRRPEGKHNSLARGRHFRLNVGKAPGGIERADAVADMPAIQRFS